MSKVYNYKKPHPDRLCHLSEQNIGQQKRDAAEMSAHILSKVFFDVSTQKWQNKYPTG